MLLRRLLRRRVRGRGARAIIRKIKAGLARSVPATRLKRPVLSQDGPGALCTSGRTQSGRVDRKQQPDSPPAAPRRRGLLPVPARSR